MRYIQLLLNTPVQNQQKPARQADLYPCGLSNFQFYQQSTRFTQDTVVVCVPFGYYVVVEN